MSSFAEQNDMTNMAFAFILTTMKALLGFEKTSCSRNVINSYALMMTERQQNLKSDVKQKMYPSQGSSFIRINFLPNIRFFDVSYKFQMLYDFDLCCIRFVYCILGNNSCKRSSLIISFSEKTMNEMMLLQSILILQSWNTFKKNICFCVPINMLDICKNEYGCFQTITFAKREI